MKHAIFSRFSQQLLLCMAVVLATAVLAVGLLPAAHAAGTIYVDDDSTCSSGCGASWGTAYSNLQDALTAAQSGDQIWVAEGIYYPDEGSGQANDDRTTTYTLADGVAIYGGFAGTEASLEERSNPAPATVLSGDIDQNDTTDASGVVPDTANIAGGNAYHVVTGGGVDETAVLDNLIITAGQADAPVPDHQGGGMINDDASPTLTQVTFSGNFANGNGGGIYNDNGSSPMLTNVTLNNNRSANGYGGGIYNYTSSNPTLTHVIFRDNYASGFGGGMGNSSSSPTLNDVLFQENSVNGSGGGMYSTASQPSLTAVTFISNTANINGGGMFNVSGSAPILTDATFFGNEANYGGGMANQGSTPELTAVTFSNNTATTYGSGMHNNFSDSVLIDVTFADNHSTTQGGGMYNVNSSPTLTNVTFSNNSASSYGGGLRNYSNSHPTLTNVTFSGNHADAYGGGLLNANSNPTLTNITFSANSAGSGGSGIANFASSPTLINVIIANGVSSSDCRNDIDSTIAAGSSHNLIEDTGSEACDLVHNVDNNIIGQDPQLGPLQDNGGSTLTHALLAGSPAIDAGDNSACPSEDQRGQARLQPGDLQCDIGAYERDTFPPQIVSMVRADANPSEVTSVDFVVTFSEDVVSLDANDFSLATTGTLSGFSITGIVGAGAVYTITVDAGTGGGSLQLDIPDTATITDMSDNALSGLPYTGGEAYTILGIKIYVPMIVR